MDANGQEAFLPKQDVASARGNQSGISLVLVLPDAATIGKVICDAALALSNLTDDYEIIVVDNGSTNSLAEIAPAAAGKNPEIKRVSVPRGAGYGTALRAGLRTATKPLVGYAEARGQYDFRQLDRLLLLARDDVVATGYRIESQGTGPRRLWDSSFSLLARLLLGTESRDCNCAFKLLRREVLQALPQQADGPLIHAELLAQARLQGRSVVEVGVTHRPLANGTERHSLVAMIHSLVALLRFWWSEIQFPAATPVRRANSFVSPAVGLALLTLIAAPVLLLNLSYPLVEPDENRVAQIALEMFQSGDYIVPTRHGTPYLSKPPLLFWSISAGYRLFGIHEWSARLPVALAALLTVLMTYLLGRQAVGDRAAWLGALLLLLTGGFVLAGRFLLMDAMLTLFTTIGMLAAHAGAASHRRRAAWWLLAGVACGLGILVKGPVALVLVVPPFAAAAWLSPRDFSIRWREGLLLVGAALALSAPWYVQVAMRHDNFLGEFLWKQNIQRYTNAFDHHQPWWFYIPALFLGMLPASALFPALAIFLSSRRAELRSLRSPGLGFLTLAAGWVVLFFSLSSSKLPTYILPAIPPLCLLLGRLVDAVLLPSVAVTRESLQPYYLRQLISTLPRHAIVAFGVVGIGLGVTDFVLGRDGVWESLVGGIVVAGSAMLLIAASVRRLPQGAAGWSFIAAAGLVVMVVGFNDLFPEVAARRSHLIQASEEVIAAREQARTIGVPVVLYGTLSESASFYTDDRSVRKFSKDQYAGLLALAQQHPQILVLATRSNAATVGLELPPTHQLIRHPHTQYVYELTDRRSQAERTLANRRDSKSR